MIGLSLVPKQPRHDQSLQKLQKSALCHYLSRYSDKILAGLQKTMVLLLNASGTFCTSSTNCAQSKTQKRHGTGMVLVYWTFYWTLYWYSLLGTLLTLSIVNSEHIWTLWALWDESCHLLFTGFVWSKDKKNRAKARHRSLLVLH